MINSETIKESVIKSFTNKKARVNIKAFKSYVKEVEKETEFEKWTQDREVMESISRSNEDFDFYGVFTIRFIGESQRFLGFMQEENLIYDLLHKTDDLGLFMNHFNAFIDVLTNDLHITWNVNELQRLRRIRWITNFYIRLQQISKNLLFSIKRNTFYDKNSGVYISIQFSQELDFVDVKVNNNSITIHINRFTEQAINKLEKQFEEKAVFQLLNAKNLSGMFSKNLELRPEEYENLYFNSINFNSHERQKMMKYIEKSVPGPLLDVMYTTQYRKEVIEGPYMTFKMEYYKCDYGYFLFDLNRKCVIHKDTREEIFNLCMNNILLNMTKVKNHS